MSMFIYGFYLCGCMYTLLCVMVAIRQDTMPRFQTRTDKYVSLVLCIIFWFVMMPYGIVATIRLIEKNN